MLLITRRPGEAIVINGDITVKVVDIRGGRVKLGFEFPQGNTVYREELFTKIQAENKAAALGSGAPLGDVLRRLPTSSTLTTTNGDGRDEHNNHHNHGSDDDE
ncbi:MAG: carbon storage regulator [Pseudomonadaceae bacterium]|nr:carbon storage regulator [Pseudomonadaceae bacterium]